MSFSSLRRVLRTARKGLCATCSKTRYPQLEAAGAGHVGCLIYTMETIGTLIKDDHEVTAMHIAARKGQISILIYLIENNVVKPDAILKARNGATPAHDAAGTGNLECLRYLLSRTQAGPNDLDGNAATLLHWAAQSGHIKVVQWLVADAQAPIDVVAKNGITPFHLAAAKNHLDVLRWLVGFAFRHHQHPMKLVNAKDKNGSTPLYHAAHAGHFEIVNWLATKGGGDPTVTNRQGLAPLHAATIAGNMKVVQFLFQFGLATAPGGLRTSEGASSLHFAAAENHIEIMNWLIAHKECSGNERDYYQSTPIHDAAENGHIISVKMLCDNNADPTLPDVEGNTPRDLAAKFGHLKCVAYLDNHIKELMKRRINGNVATDPSGVSRSKLQRSRQTQGQMMDRYRHAPPHVRPVSAFDGEDEYMMHMINDTEEGWETLHDLMDEDEIEQLDELGQALQEHNTVMTDAEKKRRIFEENLSREHEERQRKLLAAVRQEEEREMEIRSQFMKESRDSLFKVQSLEDAVREGHIKLESELGQHVKPDTSLLQPKVTRKEKSSSLPRSLQETETTKSAKRTKDDMDTGSIQSKQGSVWSKLLGKRTTGGIPHSKSWSDYSQQRKSRRPDPYEWSIPNPPPLPTVEFLTGKSRVPHKAIFSLKEELQQVIPSSVWGRDAYDDKEEGSDSDQDRPTDKQLVSQTKAKSLKGKKRKKREVTDSKQKKTLSQQRQSTPMPSLESVQVPKSDFLSKAPNNKSGIQPVRVAPPPPSPTRSIPSPPNLPQENKKTTVSAPIAKAASARSRKPLVRQDTPIPDGFANQLQQALTSAQGQQPKALHSNQHPISPERQLSIQQQITPPQNLQLLSEKPKLQRQPAIHMHMLEESQQENESDDDSSFTSSSDEETESSEEDSSDDSDDGDRPVMARNMGIHGAKIAKEVMQRMKNQRYPSIFLRPIITLDTLVEVRHEVAYEADTNEEMADIFFKFFVRKNALLAWKNHVKRLQLARQKAEAMTMRHRKVLIANAFYSWIQAKNEADVEVEEKIRHARTHYQQKMKKKVLQKWKTVMQIGVKHCELEEKSLQWLNAQMMAIGKPQVDNLLKSLADGTLIIIALANATGKKLPRYKVAPKVKIHKQDNWKIAHEFMVKVGINTRDFEPADLANLEEHAIHNMFNNIFKWLNN